MADVPATPTLPPGPRRSATAQTLEWIVDPARFMRRCDREYGDTFTARLGPRADVVFMSDPADVKAVFHGKPSQMDMGDINGLFRRVLGRHSLLVIDGEEHLRQRRLLAPPFRVQRIDQHYPSMLAAASEDVETWPVGTPFRLAPRMQAMTLNVILGAVFGLRAGPRRDRLRVLLARMLQLSLTRAVTMPQLRYEAAGHSGWGKLMRCLDEVDQALYAEIALRREEGENPGDVLSLLLEARDADGQPMTDLELRDQLITLLVSGHETTATALAWAFERVLRHPHVLARLRDDLAQGDTAYLDATIKESLRLRPVLPITARKLSVPYEVGDRTYPVGTVLMPCIFLLHRNPSVYDAPEQFRPERFLDNPPPPYGFIPFGGGARRCLGAGFAEAEMRAVMQTVLTRVELRAQRQGPERIARRSFTLSPGRGSRVVVTRRL
jgi:cytochrome P450